MPLAHREELGVRGHLQAVGTKTRTRDVRIGEAFGILGVPRLHLPYAQLPGQDKEAAPVAGLNRQMPKVNGLELS